MPRRIVYFIVIVVVAAAAGCGQKGPLHLPGEAERTQQNESYEP